MTEDKSKSVDMKAVDKLIAEKVEAAVKSALPDFDKLIAEKVEAAESNRALVGTIQLKLADNTFVSAKPELLAWAAEKLPDWKPPLLNTRIRVQGGVMFTFADGTWAIEYIIDGETGDIVSVPIEFLKSE
jgi:hypothetical protein